eukprot:CAMPEP_0172522434 /NCGR_PEP_ID=MMETSP1066-20121228/293120_1 /TAXON_ID=671091 /ORGANISM="Coscinodiscus wailesii, Strain CCMP2513" /LENGTH=469 /DNA_ID=CAMNT_0013305433 /DNA_START=130 /DNA_END=1539 /DNA_ORIENTATION=+
MRSITKQPLTLALISSLSPHLLSNTLASEIEYGVDVSFPMHHHSLSTNYPWLLHNADPANNPTPRHYRDMPLQPLGNRQKFYDDFMSGCRKHYGAQGPACDSVEEDRISMSLVQPRGMVNYTDTGFKKIKCPERMYKLIKDFYDENKGGEKEEQWFTGNTYTNHWDAPTYMVSFEDMRLRGAGSSLKRKLWNMAKETMQEWTGEEVTECSLYGVRVYKEGALLSTHVDRLPLVASAIINVDQDVDEPWPIEVIGHDGKAYNVTMEPGDMVLYESHSVLHGRPYPLKGRFYANVFIHFEPTGHSLRHHGLDFGQSNVNEKYKIDSSKGIGGHEHDNGGLPTYITQGSEWAQKWRQEHGQEVWEPAQSSTFTTGSTEAHVAASEGDLDALREIAVTDKTALTKKDKNGWEPIHEAARNGHVEVVRFLHENGSNINEKTNYGNGQTPFQIAYEQLGGEHPVLDLLKSLGAEL